MADSSIEWTDSTWNPVAGCTVITAGCTNCYAMRMAARLAAMGTEKYRGLTRKSGRRYIWTGTSVEDDRVLHRIDALRQVPAVVRFISFEPLIGSVAGANLSGIHWVIVGGESGPRARPMNPEWVNEIEGMCRSAGIAFFFKQ